MHYIYEHIYHFYIFKGLHEFMDKFHPYCSPRYLVYPSPASLIPAWIATGRADAGDTLVGDALRDLIERRFSKSS